MRNGNKKKKGRMRKMLITSSLYHHSNVSLVSHYKKNSPLGNRGLFWNHFAILQGSVLIARLGTYIS